MAIGIFLFSTRNVLHQFPQVYSIPQDVINIQQISLTPGIRTIVRKERVDAWRTEAEDTEASVYKGYKRDKIEMRGDRAEMSDFPLYLNTVAGGLDCRNQAIGGFSFVVKIYALPVVEIIGQFLYLLGRYGFDAQIGYCF